MTEHPPLYTMTWGEVEERALRGETLTTSCGYLVCGRDRKYRELGAYAMFRQDVSEAIERGREVHPENLKVNLKQRHPVNKVNKKGRPFSWSYSALSNFTGCPKRYAHEKFWCDVPWVDTDAIIFGNRVHTACEQAVKGEAVKEPGLLAPVQKYIDLFRKRGAEAELEIVLDRNCKPVKGKKAWFSEKAWFRAKLDVVLTDGVKAGIYDWKTGEKVRDDTEQLKICCSALSIVRPELEEFVGKLIWTKHDTATGGCNLTKAEAQAAWAETLGKVKRMEQAWETENFPARSSGLCPWCPVYDRCEYRR